MSNLLNGLNNYATKLLNTPSIDLHVDYDGFNALVYEGAKNYVYFTFNTDLVNKAFIMNVLYFDINLNLIFKEVQKYNSLEVAISDLLRIIRTLEAVNTVSNSNSLTEVA